jgi:hypothetical protein
MVSKRYFLHASGFDPYDAAAHHRRFVREAVRFAATWNVSVEVSALQQTDAGGGSPCQSASTESASTESASTESTSTESASTESTSTESTSTESTSTESTSTESTSTESSWTESSWTVTTAAPGWRVATQYVLMDWSDIVRSELEKPAGLKLVGGLIAFGDIVRTGTAWRYFTANWRYGMFFLVPFLNVFLFTAIAIVAGCYAGTAASALSSLAGIPAAVASAAGAFAALMRWPGERWRVGQAMADWMFARDYMLGRNAAMSARIAAFAARIVACARLSGAEEIVISGHSLGAVVAVDALVRAFDRDPALGHHGPKLALLTIGAVIPKIALHPRGGWLREKAQRLAVEPSLTWAEYQARDDFISFYRVDPVKLVAIGDRYRPQGLVIGRVQIFRMLSEENWRRFRYNYMRLHYQFVMANERRTAYDYFMLMCGPAPFRQTVTVADGPAALYGADGSYAGAAAGGSSPAPRVDALSLARLPSTANG